MAIGSSSEARATELRSLQSGGRGVVVPLYLTNLNSDTRSATEDSVSSVQVMQKPFWTLSSHKCVLFNRRSLSLNIKEMLKKA